ncbi:DUF6093 family protein, partial [Streptomyces sp. NPDC005878]|uniref:DUF6093 family protein n=1 Tax=Streptomyces sp. NPDC005878 TaxID=3157077 RepID=UPI0033EBF361
MANLDGVLAKAATLIEGLVLRDTVRITLPATGPPVLDPATGELERPVGTVLYEGPGAVQPQAQSRQAVAPDAGQPWVGETISRYRLLTPLDAPIAPKDALVTVTAVHNPFRDALLGRSWVCTD